MDEMRANLREALSRLLAATATVELDDDGAAAELLAARDHAARALLLHRARVGRPWVTSSEAGTFFERWRTVKLLDSSSR
jgi:hypothetical protein